MLAKDLRVADPWGVTEGRCGLGSGSGMRLPEGRELREKGVPSSML